MAESVTTIAVSPNPPQPQKRSKRKYDKSKLPTPPPDPQECKEPNDTTDNDILAYIEQLQKQPPAYSRSPSNFAAAIVSEDAFDHLEKLYKLMEQMLELREQNAKLHRRVRDLEHLNNLEKMHKELGLNAVQADCPELEKDTAFAETILESILADQKAIKPKTLTPTRLRQSLLRRHRSSSATEKSLLIEPLKDQVRRASAYIETSKKPSKVSKWTKVKAAFKWEKASPTVGDSKSQDSGISGNITPVHVEVAKYLRVPSGNEDGAAHSPADSGAAEISTPGTLSTASSNEDFHRSGLRTPYDEFKSSDDEHSHNNSSHSKDERNVSPRSSQKSHKTPWAKMKDIIHTGRGSVRKKHRLSAQSDDIQIDVELCSDNEDVFEEETKNKSPATLPSTPCSMEKFEKDFDIPLEVVQRYQELVRDDTQGNVYTEPRKTSKWSRVKKAFLTSAENPDISNRNSTNKDSKNAQCDNPQLEIDRNYRQLQRKLSLEFQEKISKYSKQKNQGGAGSPSGLSEDSQDPAFIKKMEEWQKIKSNSSKQRSSLPVASEGNLPPEFKKKLEEWEKIKKSNSRASCRKSDEDRRTKSPTGQKPSSSQLIEYPVISDDFKKKLQEWRQIKASGSICANDDTEHKKLKGDKTPSPNLYRKDSKYKRQQEKELQWFEKELGKIEKEKQRLEREHQKFLDREERLTKLRRSVMGSSKKDILVHTSSGFHRFEGISRKFAQKLYEWEQSQGIAPEASTFALLSKIYTPEQKNINLSVKTTENPSALWRSRSADSIALSAFNLACPLLSQPSSLSLNDVEDLEKECLADSKTSSMQYLLVNSHESLEAEEPETEEPEALIVEVEDIVVETAAPLKTFVEQHNPVYQRQEIKAMCEGETCIAPKIRRSESTRAQSNYNLIEEIFVDLNKVEECEKEIRRSTGSSKERGRSLSSLKDILERQCSLVRLLLKKLTKLHEENSTVTSTLTKESLGHITTNLADVIEAVQDLSLEIQTMADKLLSNIQERAKLEKNIEIIDLFKQCRDIRNKIFELRRHLSYICAASDLTSPRLKRLNSGKKKTQVTKTISNESNDSKCESSSMSRDNSSKSSKDGRLYVKSENITQSQGAIKKKIKYRQKNMTSRDFLETDDEEDNSEHRKKHRKLVRMRSTSEGSVKYTEPKNSNHILFNKSAGNLNDSGSRADSPVTVFVKTTRKLFTPLVESSLAAKSGQIDKTSKSEKGEEIKIEPILQKSATISHLPPLPASPTPQRKLHKEVSPSIKLMLAKYNQKISELESHSKPAGTSGSTSPIAWRSPTAERRVKVQMEKYQEELKKLSPLTTRKDLQIQKSASFGSGLSKESSLNEKSGAIFNTKSLQPSIPPVSGRKSPSLKLHLQKCYSSSPNPSSESRLRKLQRAKEEFLNSGPVSAPPLDTRSQEIKFPGRNRLSQISMDSSSSYSSTSPGALVKSVSVGMINIDVDHYRQFEPEVHGDGYVSLPRSPKKTFGSAFSNIASKFRKVKMRRGKDKEKFSAVSALCRQSLVVDINTQNNQNDISKRSVPSASAPTTPSEPGPSTSKGGGTWTKLFKK